MIELGKRQDLTVFRKRENGLYIGETEEEAILLPASEAGSHDVGDVLNVFVYKDSEDRLIATAKKMPIELGSAALLPVVQTAQIGAFLDWGLPKNLFLPFKEQRGRIKEGQKVPVILYVDKSGRLAASMKIYGRLAVNGPYKADDTVTGLIYELKPELGAFVAVDGRYAGFIHRQEIYEKLQVGQTVTARVIKVREDGKLDLTPRKKAYAQMDEDAAKVMECLKSYDGVLPFGEKAEPARIQAELGLSKAAFKRAVGRLLKEGYVITGDEHIRLAALDKK
ncbi:MAG: S1 RNA-binding domain-containing protein [Lachnospiraceae bacterium]|nr:S1 RNA-binding domain-containing protein [Lachnospiraceae bacterium]